MDGGGDAQVENLSDSFFTSAGAQVLDGPDGEEHLESGDNEDTPREHEPLREQDRFLPIANVARIMKKSIPKNGKIAKEAKECVQECVSEFISFITSEASERCHQEKRKTINGEDILFAMNTLGFDCYVEPLKIYLQKYRESMKGDKPMGGETDLSDMVDASAFEISQQTLAANILDPNGQQNVIYTTAFANQEFESKMCDGQTFDGEKLKGEIPGDNLMTDLVDDLITYVDKRFENFIRAPLKSFQAFNIHNFPERREDLASYGNEEINQLMEHFTPIMNTDDSSPILTQYVKLKAALKSYSNSNMSKSAIFKKLLTSKNPEMPEVLKLLEIMLVVSPSTAECERGFSLMNNLKNLNRNCMCQDTLRMLMNIKSQGPISDETIDRAIGSWLISGPGSRHILS